MAAQAAKPKTAHKVTTKRRPRSHLGDEEKKAIVTIATENPRLTHQQIADLKDVERSTVSRILAEYKIDARKNEEFKAHRADVFAGLQHRILKNITDEEIKKAPLQVKMMSVGIAYDKERLERGESTENIGIVGKLIREIRDESD
jgi:CRISPR/Cas system CSM-associated protein Csm2 small subunit